MKRRKKLRLITNFWVARPKKPAPPYVDFMQARVIEPKSKADRECAKKKDKSAILSRANQEYPSCIPKHQTDFPVSLHAILI